MMRRFSTIFAACLMMIAAAPAFGQTEGEKSDVVVLGREIMPKDTVKQHRFKNRLITPKGEWQCGLSVMYADFLSENSDYMLVLQGLGANASMLRLAPEAAYTFKDNHAIGAKFQYTNVNGRIDSATADLLGNFSTTLEDVNASTRSTGGCIFQRTYVGLDQHGRVGIFWDYVLGFTRSRSQFYMGSESSAFTLKKKAYLSFAPGIVYFPMNNVSVQASISMAELSYSDLKAFEGGSVVGSRNQLKAKAALNILDISFGLTIHL